MIEQERLRQTRYKEALSFLAHSLKTPLAVLRNSTQDEKQLPEVVAENETGWLAMPGDSNQWATLLAEAMKRISEESSVSSLFD